MLVANLEGARDRKRAATGRCEGRKPAPEAAREMAVQLRTEGKGLGAISLTLAEAGFVSPSGKPYSKSSVQAMMRD